MPKLRVIDGELWATPKPPKNARLISYSELQSMDCWLKHHYAYHLRLKPTERYIGLRLGAAWDAFYNAWHTANDVEGMPGRLGDPDDTDTRLEIALRAASDEIAKDWRRVDAELLERNMPRPVDWREQLEELHTTIMGMALHYVARWGAEDTSRTVGVQVRFAVPLPSATGERMSNKFYLHGVIDRLMLTDIGDLWIVDAKLRLGWIEEDWRESFERDPQLALYGWALRQAGWPVVGGVIDAASAQLPRWPQLKQQPETVYTDEVDADGKPVPLQEPVLDDETGEPVVYKSGARKGEPKMRNVKRPALYHDWQNTTSLLPACSAIAMYGLPPSQYGLELQQLEHEWTGELESRFHWRMVNEGFTDAELTRASRSVRGVASYLDTLPPEPMPSKMKCKYCAFNRLCPSLVPADYAEGFTTSEQRETQRMMREAAEAQDEAMQEAFR